MRISLSMDRRTCVPPSPRVLEVAAMFGLGVDEERMITIVPPVTLDLEAGSIIFITGPSGGGKSTLLRLIAQACIAMHGEGGQCPGRTSARVVRFDDLPALEELPLVDALKSAGAAGADGGAIGGFVGDGVRPCELSLERVLELLSLAGLSDAFIMLRKPGELSDGQRHRLRLAQAMALAERDEASLCIVLADEFGATLDRITAKVLARNVRRWVSRARSPICFIAATTHDDLLESLEPDVLVEKGLGPQIEIARRGAVHGQ